jgi:hypothetical protein
MKMNIRILVTAFLATLTLTLACAKIFAAGPANSTSAVRPLIVGTTNSVLASSDTNFFAANSNLLNASVTGGSGGGGNATNATQVNGVTGPLNITLVNVSGPSNGASAIIISGTNGVIYITNCQEVFTIDGLSGAITGVITNNNLATVTLQNLTINTNVNVTGTINAGSAAISGALTASGGSVISGGVSNIITSPYVISNTGSAELDLDSEAEGFGLWVSRFAGPAWTNLTQTTLWELLDPAGNTPIIVTNNGGIVFSRPTYFSQINGVIGTLSGTISANIVGNAGGLSNLQATNLTDGPIPYAVLPSGVVTNNETQATAISSLTLNNGPLTVNGDGQINIGATGAGTGIIFPNGLTLRETGTGKLFTQIVPLHISGGGFGVVVDDYLTAPIVSNALTILGPASEATALVISNAANTNGVIIHVGTNLGSMAIRGSPSNQNTVAIESGINATNILKGVHVTATATNDVFWLDANGNLTVTGTVTENGSVVTTNAGLVWINPQIGSNYLINLSAYTNTANLVLAIVCTNNVQISFTNPPSGLSFAIEAFNGSSLTNSAAFNSALASTNLYPVRTNTTGVVTTLPTTSTNSHITSAFIVNGTNVDLCAQSQFNY